MGSQNPVVQLKATHALATFIYNNSSVQILIGRNHQLPFNYFKTFLESNSDHMRCSAAFQVYIESLLMISIYL